MIYAQNATTKNPRPATNNQTRVYVRTRRVRLKNSHLLLHFLLFFFCIQSFGNRMAITTSLGSWPCFRPDQIPSTEAVQRGIYAHTRTSNTAHQSRWFVDFVIINISRSVYLFLHRRIWVLSRDKLHYTVLGHLDIITLLSILRAHAYRKQNRKSGKKYYNIII